MNKIKKMTSKDFDDSIVFQREMVKDLKEELAKEIEKTLRLTAKLAKAKAALEHYDSSHYCNRGFPCNSDKTAREALKEIGDGDK